ncbi:MAG TPA: 2Fe-2S iron-sulfur cluster-binding protein [Candidatus Limnocylindria bacterium]|nr:2Fe-2S iron-sulfur cluster-binding protein [Candidatus Limnocylindria bacterium]
MTDVVEVQVNGERVRWDGDPAAPLLDVLRETLALTGTKLGCGTGECGACSIVVDGVPQLACLLPVAAVAGRSVRTVEDLARTPEFAALREAMVVNGGTQCGFCTPGVMVALWSWLEAPDATERSAAEALKNNLCRCTGYRGILDAAEAARRALGR